MGAHEHVRYWPRWAALVSFVGGLLALVTAGASGGGLGDTTALPAGPGPSGGIISGLVRSGGAIDVQNRLVEVVDVATGERHRVTTDRVGAFTFRVKPGTYRLQVALLSGESLVNRPGLLRVRPDTSAARAELVIRTVRLSRPRSPVYQPATGLGAPVV